jgi:hypothetical protein
VGASGEANQARRDQDQAEALHDACSGERTLARQAAATGVPITSLAPRPEFVGLS